MWGGGNPTLTLLLLLLLPPIRPPGALKRSGETFQYDATFGPRSTQEDVYKQVAAPVVEQVCRGMNCCVMAYGQTGTGKTFTMAGDVSPAGIAEGRHGLIPRSVQNIFEAGTVTDEFTGDEIARAKVTVSFLEVYNEQLEDLLAAPSAGAGHAPSSVPLKLVDDRENGVVCQNLTEVEVCDVHHVMELLEEAQERSHVSATKLNKQSNRAHRIFTITATYGESAKHRKVGRLTLVDLAGSECVGRSGAVDMMAKEAGTINKSLLTLGRVIQALAANEKHVPYRDSKLTRLLAEALGVSCVASVLRCSVLADVVDGFLFWGGVAVQAVYAKHPSLPRCRQLPVAPTSRCRHCGTPKAPWTP